MSFLPDLAGATAVLAITAAAVALTLRKDRQRERERREGRPLALLDEGWIASRMAAQNQYRATVHQTPDHDAVPQITPCCEKPVMDLPADEPFTHEPQKVTCTGGEG